MTDSPAVETVVRSAKPDVVVNAAAMTDVDACERDPEGAKRLNETAPGILASISRDVGAAFVQASTDYVFDGSEPAAEGTTPHPLNTYGLTKLAGEAVVRGAHANALILRLSAVYGWNRVSQKTNAVTWILEKLETGKEAMLFRDQKVTPTYAKTAAEVAFDLWSRRASGLFHVASAIRNRSSEAHCDFYGERRPSSDAASCSLPGRPEGRGNIKEAYAEIPRVP